MSSVTLWKGHGVEARWNKGAAPSVVTATNSRSYPNEGAAIAAAKRKAAKAAKQGVEQ